METVNEPQTLGILGDPSPHGIRAFLSGLTQVLYPFFASVAHRVNAALVKDGSEAMTAALPLATFTLATRPTVAGPGMIFVSDAAAGQRFQAWDVTAGAWVPLG